MNIRRLQIGLSEYATKIPGLAAYYSCGERTGANSSRDVSTNALHGTPTSVTFGSTGQIGRAYTLDGAASTISIGDVASLQFERTNPFSIMAIVRKTTADAIGNIFAKMESTADNARTRGYRLAIFDNAGTNRLRFTLCNDIASNALTMTGTTALSSTVTWYAVAVTYAGNSAPSDVNLYVNGVLETPITVGSNLSATIANSIVARIGSRGTAQDQFFPGLTQHITIVNRVLNLNEVQKYAQLAGLS